MSLTSIGTMPARGFCGVSFRLLCRLQKIPEIFEISLRLLGKSLESIRYNRSRYRHGRRLCCESTMPTENAQKFNALIENVAREIVAAEHHVGGSFLRLPLLYPSGATVVVRIEQGDNRYFVSDWGLGYQETDLYGAGTFYVRHGRQVAEKAGVGFDNQAFFVMEASREQLAGAVVTIGNCSQEAAMRAADALAEKTFEDSAAVCTFSFQSSQRRSVRPKRCDQECKAYVGHSSTSGRSQQLCDSGQFKPTIFEPRDEASQLFASASMKFHDIALLGKEAPNRVAHCSRKENNLGRCLTCCRNLQMLLMMMFRRGHSSPIQRSLVQRFP